jgi:hypothetical protein
MRTQSKKSRKLTATIRPMVLRVVKLRRIAIALLFAKDTQGTVEGYLAAGAVGESRTFDARRMIDSARNQTAIPRAEFEIRPGKASAVATNGSGH